MIKKIIINFIVFAGSLLFCILLIEGMFRLIGYDFKEANRRAYEAYPIYYRQARKPLGEVFFHRYGPMEWTGQVLARTLEQEGGVESVYEDEEVITVRYDKQGFRNPDDMKDWDIVVVGDSMLELGFLKYEDLMTTHMSKMLNVNVKNLGLSYSGPPSYIAYLKNFGKSSYTQHAIMAFFEGNDLGDLEKEVKWLSYYQSTGKRGDREFSKQTSFVRAVKDIYQQIISSKKKKERVEYQNAWLIFPEKEVPISVEYLPPTQKKLSEKRKQLLEKAVLDWAKAANQLGVKPWIVYFPCKRRVFHGHLRFKEGTKQKMVDWQPTDLPEYMKMLCAKHQIGFMDVTQDLVQDMQKGHMTYNPIWDTHFNQRGAYVAAESISRQLKPFLK